MRLGVVKVCEASVIIGVSSTHRKEALESVSYLIDALKASVPIWKREIYSDDLGEWKRNQECQWTKDRVEEAVTSSEIVDDSGRITIFSRKKQSNLNSMFADQNEDSVKTALSAYEKSLVSGLNQLRQTLASVDARHQATLHNSETLDGIVQENIQDKIALNNRYKNLQFNYDQLEEENKGYQNNAGILSTKLLSMGETHKERLKIIAKNERENWLARHFFNIWRDKVRNGPSSKVCLLELEVDHLRKELLKCQDDAKQAFLRSANRINSEALSLFNDAATRRLGPSIRNSKESEDGVKAKLNRKENNNKLSLFEGSDDSDSQLDDPTLSQLDGRGKRILVKSKTSNERTLEDEEERAYQTYLDKKKRKRQSQRDFHEERAEKLRQKTKHLMQTLQPLDNLEESSSSSYSPDATKLKYPSTVFNSSKFSNSHHAANASLYHHCRCGENAESGSAVTNCQYCRPVKHFGLASLPIHTMRKKTNIKSRPQSANVDTGGRSVGRKNVAFASIENRDRSKVLYKPSGSTVVIEKHLSS